MIVRTNFDGVIMAPDWQRSRGCRKEHQIFLEAGWEILEYAEMYPENDGLPSTKCGGESAVK